VIDSQRIYERLDEAVSDPVFPEADSLLRKGVHIGLEDAALYAFLVSAKDFLDIFYEGFSARLIHSSEGFFYLLSDGDLIGQRQLTPEDMLLGQVLAYLRTHPKYLEEAGKIPIEHVFSTLELMVGAEKLAEIIVRRQRGRNTETDNRKIREAIQKSINKLARLGFIFFHRSTNEISLRKTLLRFADPLRISGDIHKGLEELVKTGKISIGEEILDTEEDENEDE
jgi:chromosome partition protein MukE